LNRCRDTRCGHLNRHAARYCARCGHALTGSAFAGERGGGPALRGAPNPVLSTATFFVASLLVIGGLFFVLTGGPVPLGLGLIVFSCVALSPREHG
jgi:hypothetical protein